MEVSSSFIDYKQSKKRSIPDDDPSLNMDDQIDPHHDDTINDHSFNTNHGTQIATLNFSSVQPQFLPSDAFNDPSILSIINHYSPRLIGSFGWSSVQPIISSDDSTNAPYSSATTINTSTLNDLNITDIMDRLNIPTTLPIYNRPNIPLYLYHRLTPPIPVSKPPLSALLLTARLHGYTLLPSSPSSSSSSSSSCASSSSIDRIRFIGYRANIRRLLSSGSRCSVDCIRLHDSIYFRRHLHYEFDDKDSFGSLFEEACHSLSNQRSHSISNCISGISVTGNTSKYPFNDGKVRVVVECRLGSFDLLTSMEVDSSQSTNESCSPLLSSLIEIKSGQSFNRNKRRDIWLQCFLGGISRVIFGLRKPFNQNANSSNTIDADTATDTRTTSMISSSSISAVHPEKKARIDNSEPIMSKAQRKKLEKERKRLARENATKEIKSAATDEANDMNAAVATGVDRNTGTDISAASNQPITSSENRSRLCDSFIINIEEHDRDSLLQQSAQCNEVRRLLLLFDFLAAHVKDDGHTYKLVRQSSGHENGGSQLVLYRIDKSNNTNPIITPQTLTDIENQTIQLIREQERRSRTNINSILIAP